VLTGTNTYTGGTAITGGTLQLGNGGTTGSIVGDVLDNGTLAFNRSNALDFSGAIFGTGGVQQNGTGTTILSAVNGYTGATTVNSGTLDVEGSIASSSLTTVNGGALLTGNGIVGNTQINSGARFAPGTIGTPGTGMIVLGGLTFQSGAIYNVFLNPLTNTLAFVTGNAALRGMVFADFATGNYATKIYDILHSSGLNGTRFDGLQISNLPAGSFASLSYSDTDVFLTLLTLLPGNLPSQQGVANALNSFLANNGMLPPNFVPIMALTGADLVSALKLLNGEVSADAERGAFQLMSEFLDVMLDPWVGGRLTDDGESVSVPFAPEKTSSFPPDVALAYAGVLKGAAKAQEQRWSLWASSYGGSAMANGDAATGSSNVGTRTFGFAGGVDYRLTRDTVIGAALAGGGTNWGLSTGLGSGKSDAFQAGVYGKTRFGQGYVAGALGFSEYWMSTSRTAFAGDRLSSSFNAQSYGARVESGYRYGLWQSVGVTPYGALQAQLFHAPRYSETDLTAGGFGLSYASTNASDTRSELGTRFDWLQRLGGMPVLLRGRLAWVHDWVSTPSVSAAFQMLPGTSFIVNGAPFPHDAALTSIGAELRIRPGLSLLGKFDGEFAAGSQTYAGTGTLRFTW